MVRLFHHVKPYKGKAALIFIFLLMEMVFNSLVPLTFMYIIDKVLIGHDHRLLLVVLASLGIGAVAIFLTGMWRDYLYAVVSAKILQDIRQQIFHHLQNLSSNFYSRYKTGDVLSRFSSDLVVVENALNSTIGWGILPFLDVIGTTFFMFILDWRLALVAMLIWPFALIGPWYLAQHATNAGYKRKEDEAAAISTVQENVVTQTVVKGFSLQETELNKFKGHNTQLSRSSLKTNILNAFIERTASIGVVLLQVLVMGIGAYMASKELISIGTLAAFQTLFLNLSLAVTTLTQFMPSVLQAQTGLTRIDELLKEPPRVVDSPDAKTIDGFLNEITFNNVTFGYTGDNPNLVNAELAIRCGSFVAFVGSSGSGKSTAMNLLVRFYDPDTGSVSIDGTNIRNVTQKSLRSRMGIVFQEPLLFNTSIRENILLGKPDATEEEIISAAKAAEIHEVIIGFERGYDTQAGERGTRLSGGQRQRVAIARAILRNPEIILLDEATSALDPATEASINETIEKIRLGRTVISVTHRLAAVVNADCIYVLEKGHIVETGTHDELLRVNGFYNRIWQKQSGFKVSAETGLVDIECDRLRELTVFNKLDQRTLEEAARYLYTENLPENRVVIQEGDQGDNFYIIVRGKVEILKTVDDAYHRIAVLQDGDHFGEIALLKACPRVATVRTVTPCVLLGLRREHFTRLLEDSPLLRQELMQTLETRTVGKGIA